MSKQPPRIEWEILDERPQSPAQADEPASQASLPLIASRPTHKYRLRIVASLAALFLLSSAIWLWRQAQTGLDHVQADLKSQTEVELWAVTQNNSTLANKLTVDPQATKWSPQFQLDDEMLKGLQGDDPDSHLQVNLHLLELEDEWAKAQITAQEAGNDEAYRQTRFYRHTAQGWLRTSPTAEAWGTPASLESTYFVFHFRQHDAAIVAEIAPLLDALYARIRGQFGLPPTPASAKPLVDISPTETPGASMGVNTPGHYSVPSPDIYFAPVSVSNSALLLQSLALPITRDLANEASGPEVITQVRPQLSGALSLWALWNANYPLSRWRQEIVKWRLGSEEGQSQENISQLPAHYEEICSLHGVWLPSPSLISIPLTCSEDSTSAIAVTTTNTLSKASLEELLINLYWPRVESQRGYRWSPHPGDTVILTTFFEYLVSHYGRDKLPLFLKTLGRYKDWETMCQAFFGQSTLEVTTRWQEYLVTHYGVAQDRQ